MKRSVVVGIAAAVTAAAVAGVLSRPFLWPSGETKHAHVMEQANAEPAAPAIYYQDPDGKPFYSLTPKKTPDGRDYRAVPRGGDISFDDPPEDLAAAPPADRKVRYYRNPMGLPDVSPTPRKDSMGMDYIPVYEGEDSDDGSVKVSAGKIQRTGVKSEPAARRVIHTMIRAPGTIQLDERRVSVISMRAESYVQKVASVTTGAHVVKGEPLMEIYSPAVSSAAAEYISTLNSKVTGGGEGVYGKGSRQRLMNLDIPEAAIVAIEKGRNVPIGIEWTSPRDGIVLERNAVEGMRAQPGDILFRIADHSVVWAIVDVAERDLGSVVVGQRTIVRARSFPGREFSGKINVIYPQINKETRTGRVRVELSNPDLLLIHDMYIDADIDTGSPDAVLAVPDNAVMDTGSRQVVFVDKGEGRFEPREVKLGHRGEGHVEIRQGLAEGEAVVVAANFLIDAESNLKAALKGFAEGVKP